MTPEDRAEKFKTQTDALYAGLGRFVVNFEGLVAMMRDVIASHVGNVPAPYHVRHQQVARIFTADLTAYPLTKTFRSILLLRLDSYGNLEQRPQIEKLISTLCSQIDDINKERNKLLHGTWLIEYTSEDQQDFSQAEGYKTTNTAKGLRLDQLTHDAESFSETAEKCRVLRDLVGGIGLCMLNDIDLLKNYCLKDGQVLKT